MRIAVYALAVAALCLGASAAPAAPAAAPAGEDVYAAAAKYEFGQSRKPLATIEEEIRTATPEQYKAIETKVLAALKAPGTTVDAKRFLCRYLGTVGSAQSVPALAALLTNEKLSDSARLGLEPLADPSAAAALRQALGTVKGRALAGVISSVSARRDAQAVPALAGLVSNADADVAHNAIVALGAIGTTEAAKALELAAAKVPETLRRTLAQARLTCAAALAQAKKNAEAAAIYTALMADKSAPATRVAAVRGLIAVLDRVAAVKLVNDTLQGTEAPMRAAALSAITGATDAALKTAVVEQLPTMGPEAQKAILGILPDMPDVSARPALLKIIQDGKDAATRLAALDALALCGNGEDVAMLVKLGLKDGDEAAAARRALERMAGAGVNEAIAKLLASTDVATRSLAMGLVSNRRIDAALPVLVKMTAGADAAVAAEAVKALTNLGGAAELPALIKILTTTTDANLRGAVEGAVTAICTRAADREGCSKAVLSALDAATTPAARATLIKLLPRVKTQQALAAGQKALKQEKEAEVVQAAVRALGEWPDIAAATALLDFAKAAANANDAVVAIRGCLRLAGLKDQPPAQRLAVYRSVLEVAQRPDEKKQALAGLADLPSPDALDLLGKCLADKALSADAAQAALRLAKQIGAAYRQRAETVLAQVKAQATSDELRKQVDDTVKSLSSASMTPDGTILAWMLSGPYMQEGKKGDELFDVAIGPEKDPAKAEWRVVTVPAKAAVPGLVELNLIIGGDDRVAYLKTEIASPKAQDATLEIGSDDGFKAFLNGEKVGGNNATRPAKPGDDKVKIRLKQGINTLMIKVIQGSGEWAAVVRLVGADGKPLDVTVSPAN